MAAASAACLRLYSASSRSTAAAFNRTCRNNAHHAELRCNHPRLHHSNTPSRRLPFTS
jgi:hypothetical protein